MASEQETGSEQDSKIRERAYQIWLEEGQPHGLDLEHWAQAEQEVVKGTGAPDVVKEAAAQAKSEPVKKAVSNGKLGKK